MVHPNPSSRPSAMAITHHPALCPQAQKSRAQLRKELNEERLKNEVLSRYACYLLVVHSYMKINFFISLLACLKRKNKFKKKSKFSEFTDVKSLIT